MSMIIDTHCHLNFNVYKGEVDGIIKQALDEDIWMVIVGTYFDSSMEACELASCASHGVFASVGLHPLHCLKKKVKEGGRSFMTRGERFDANRYDSLIRSYGTLIDGRSILKNFFRKNKKRKILVAIGECGLDYSYGADAETVGLQRRSFCDQLEFACESDLPVIVHARGANDGMDGDRVYEDIIKILQEKKLSRGARLRGVVHSFTGSSRVANALNELGFYIGINALIFDRLELVKTLKSLSSDYILLETDSPYFYPGADSSGVVRNEPKNLRRVLERVALIKNIDVYSLSTQTTRNARALFNLA